MLSQARSGVGVGLFQDLALNASQADAWMVRIGRALLAAAAAAWTAAAYLAATGGAGAAGAAAAALRGQQVLAALAAGAALLAVRAWLERFRSGAFDFHDYVHSTALH
jgi:hypothetical protein